MSRRNHHGGGPMQGILHDFSVSLNPLGPPDAVRQAILQDPDCMILYPDPACRSLREALSRETGVPASHIVCGNGSSDLIYRICSVCGFRKVLLAVPCFSEYERALQSNDCEISYIYTDRSRGFVLHGEYLDCGDGYDAIFVSNPVNPSGCVMDTEEMDRLLSWCEETGTVLVVDECFLDFVNPKKVDYAYRFFRHYVNDPAAGEDDSGITEEAPEIPDVIAIRSFTKSFALAGLRIGYALFTDREMAEETEAFGPPWNVSGPAQAAGLAAAESGRYLEETRSYVSAERAYLLQGLRQCGLEAVTGETNYILFRGPVLLGRALSEQGIRVRDCSDFNGLADRGGKRYYRIGVLQHEANEALLEALPLCLENSRRAASVMIQGTMSNAGKSVIAAGLCRIFSQDGYRTAPFKSQNMALNSYITADGCEIGRAQAVQAEAAGVEPSGDMNPVLLKPTTDEGSQVIVNGKSRGNMKAQEYFGYKKQLVPEIMAAYDRLAAEQDIIVIEGAGSPVELNLLEGDIVNMGLAARTGSPVILVGDIDRGGIFAQLTGTLNLLNEEDRNRVVGVIINKFRGDLTLFEKGRAMTEELCGVPVLGVVPYMDLDIDDEDSLSERFARSAPAGSSKAAADGPGPAEPSGGTERRDLQICVIRLPRISNYSDLTALGSVPGVQVRYVNRPEELDEADAIIIPGTKSTISDLRWMNERGLSDAVWLSSLAGVPVIGICGGFQMLGRIIRDPLCVESQEMEIRGIGLLPIETDYEDAKVTRQTCGTVAGLVGELEDLQGAEVRGYEIHMGRSRIMNQAEPAVFSAGGQEQLDADLLAASWNEEINGEPSWVNRLQEQFQPDDGWLEDITPFCQLEDGSFDGCVSGNVIGTYLHGLFDSAAFTERFLEILSRRAGMEPAGSAAAAGQPEADGTAPAFEPEETERSFAVPDYEAYRQEQYDRLAEGLRDSLDMELLYELIGLSPAGNGR